MKASLNSSKIKLEKLKEFININLEEEEILRKITSSQLVNTSEDLGKLVELKTSQVNRLLVKKNCYTFIIITLYGVLESFLENAIEEFINNIKFFYKNYKFDIDIKLIESHNKLCLKLIDSIPRKYEDHLTKSEILNSLYFVDKKDFTKINSKVFTYHESNFREKTVNDFFGKVSINNIINLIKRDKEFDDFLQKNSFVINEVLDDLAERRNILSHGGELIDILTIESLSKYKFFIENFINSVNNKLEEELLIKKIINEINTKKIQKLNVLDVINNEILCVELVKNCLSKKRSKLLVAKQKNTVYTYELTNIDEIQINKCSLEYVEFSLTPIHVGMKLPIKIKDNYDYYLYIE